MKNIFNNFEFQIDDDSNYPDNKNVTFIKPNNEKFDKDDIKKLKKLAKELELDPEPIMDGMYSFDAALGEAVRNGCLKAGMKEYVEVNNYVPDFSDGPEEVEGCDSDCPDCDSP